MEKITPLFGKQLLQYVEDIETQAQYNHCIGCDKHSMHQGELTFNPTHLIFRVTKICKWCGMSTFYVYTIDSTGLLIQIPQFSSQMKLIDLGDEFEA